MAKLEPIAPAIESIFSALGWLILLSVLLALPVALFKFKNLPRETVYSSVPPGHGAFTWMRDEIFNKKGEIDLLVIGSSLSWVGIDMPYLKSELSRLLGREATVVNFGSNRRSEDFSTLVLKDLLERRKVRMVVFSPPAAASSFQKEPHSQAFRWFRYGDDPEAVADLPFRFRLALAAGYVLGAPRQLLNVLRPNLLEPAAEASNFGGWPRKMGYLKRPFHERSDIPPRIEASEATYSPKHSQGFSFANRPLEEYSHYFLSRLGDLLRRHHVALMTVHFPVIELEFGKDQIEEPFFWPTVLGPSLKMVGIPFAKLFLGKSRTDAEEFYYRDPLNPLAWSHLNANGARYFTRAITPAILKAYEETAH